MTKTLGIMMLCLVLLCNVHAKAQETTAAASKAPRRVLTTEEKADHQSKKRTKELSLTEDQQKQWRDATLLFEQQKAILNQKKQAAVTREEKIAVRSEMEKHKASWDATILSILDPEQEAKWASIQQKEKEKHDKQRSEKKAQKQEEPNKP